MPVINQMTNLFPMPWDAKVSSDLVDEIVRALKNVQGYGSVEIYVQGHSVTQITVEV